MRKIAKEFYNEIKNKYVGKQIISCLQEMHGRPVSIDMLNEDKTTTLDVLVLNSVLNCIEDYNIVNGEDSIFIYPKNVELEKVVLDNREYYTYKGYAVDVKYHTVSSIEELESNIKNRKEIRRSNESSRYSFGDINIKAFNHNPEKVEKLTKGLW